MNKHFHSSRNTFPLCFLTLYFLPQLRSKLKVPILAPYRNFPSNSLKNNKILTPYELTHLVCIEDIWKILEMQRNLPSWTQSSSYSVLRSGGAADGWPSWSSGWSSLLQAVYLRGYWASALPLCVSHFCSWFPGWNLSSHRKGHHGHGERRAWAREWV